MTRSLSSAAIGLAAAVTFAAVAHADGPAQTAKQVASRSIDDVFAVLRATTENTAAVRAERMEKLRAVVDKIFDWEEMAKRSLGVHWRSATDSQRKRYLTVFKDLLANQHIDDMDKFRGTETVLVHAEEKSGGFTIVKSTLTTHSREQVPINYYMKLDNKRWWVHDISIEGVSLVNHYRKSFSRFLVNKDIEALLKRLESKNR